MKLNIHKDNRLWYNTRYCIEASDRRSSCYTKTKKNKRISEISTGWEENPLKSKDLQEEYRKMKLGIVIPRPIS